MAKTEQIEEKELRIMQAEYKLGWHDNHKAFYSTRPGLNRQVVKEVSRLKGEPDWMLQQRLKAWDHFERRSMPKWGPSLEHLDFDRIVAYSQPNNDLNPSRTWDDVPEEMKKTFERLGIPEAEREQLAGVATQYDSNAVYHNVQKKLQEQGVIFLDTDTALKEYPELFKEYFGTVIPMGDNKFAALNSALWSGGSFIYIPKGVHVEQPLQTYFRINNQSMLQAERTLIIADEGSKVSYVEGCSAPSFNPQDSLHAAVVEIIAKPGADVTYYTVQNWSTAVTNLVVKRARAERDAVVRWIQAETGSALNMKYPAIYLTGERAHGEIISMAMATEGMNQDTGGKVVHAAPNTTSSIISKSISMNGGVASYRGLLEIAKGAIGSKSSVVCDALILDDQSISNTWPTIRISEDQVDVGHEATVSKIGEDQMFYLQSRGLSEEEARGLIVNGFVEEVIKKLPMEFAVELNRLVDLQMEGSVG